MDSDGEDDPSYIPKLIDASKSNNNTKIVFASRSKRNEKLIFRIFYSIYKIIFWLFSGKKINFGNFSCLSKEVFGRIVNIPFLETHYASAILASRLPYVSIPCDKGKRYYDTSSMNITSFVIHAAKSFSVFYEKIIVRFLIFSFFGFLCSILFIFAIFINKFTATFVLVGWTSNVMLSFSILSLFFLLIFLVCLFLIINKNNFIDNSYYNEENMLSLIQSINYSK